MGHEQRCTKTTALDSTVVEEKCVASDCDNANDLRLLLTSDAVFYKRQFCLQKEAGGLNSVDTATLSYSCPGASADVNIQIMSPDDEGIVANDAKMATIWATMFVMLPALF